MSRPCPWSFPVSLTLWLYLVGRFEPCMKEVKVHIDTLIDKEYMERARGDDRQATYRYLA